jgi:hypothetical protein
MPRGARKTMVSPTARPSRARARGATNAIRPRAGSASSTPTIRWRRTPLSPRTVTLAPKRTTSVGSAGGKTSSALEIRSSSSARRCASAAGSSVEVRAPPARRAKREPARRHVFGTPSGSVRAARRSRSVRRLLEVGLAHA